MKEEMMEKNESLFREKKSDEQAGMKLTDDELQEVAGGKGYWLSNIKNSKEWANYFNQNGTVYYDNGKEQIRCYVRWWKSDDSILWDGKFTYFKLVAVRNPEEYYSHVPADKVWVNYN